MIHIHLLLFAVAWFATASAQQCEMIRVGRGDEFNTFGTCCVTWDEPGSTGRKLLGGLLGGLGLGVGIGGFLKDSKGRNISGGIGTGIGMGLGGGGDSTPEPAPAPPQIIQVPAPAPPPIQYAPPPPVGAVAGYPPPPMMGVGAVGAVPPPYPPNSPRGVYYNNPYAF